MKKHRTEERVEEYKEAKREFGRLLKSKNRGKWRDFCSEIEGVGQASKAMKILKNSDIINHCTLMDNSNCFAETAEQSLEILFNTHFDHLDHVDAAEPAKGTPPTVSDLWVRDEIFSIENIRACFNSFDNFKSPGKDRIYPILIKKAFPIVGDFLESIFLECYELWYVPKNWQTTKVVFIPKPGKPNYSNPKCFRPISLMSFSLKVLKG